MIAIAVATAAPALAQSTVYAAANISNATGAVNSTLNGTVFTNSGLVGKVDARINIGLNYSF